MPYDFIVCAFFASGKMYKTKKISTNDSFSAAWKQRPRKCIPQWHQRRKHKNLITMGARSEKSLFLRKKPLKEKTIGHKPCSRAKWFTARLYVDGLTICCNTVNNFFFVVVWLLLKLIFNCSLSHCCFSCLARF